MDNEAKPFIGNHHVYYYAAGSGNDFWRDISGGKEPEPICIDPYINNLPQVTVKGKKYYFINGIGYGIDGYCCEKGDEIRAYSDKPINYTSIAVKGLLFHYKPANAVVTVDGKKYHYKKVWLAPTMNGRFYGGGMMPTPNQNRLNEDGLVSAMVIAITVQRQASVLFVVVGAQICDQLSNPAFFSAGEFAVVFFHRHISPFF